MAHENQTAAKERSVRIPLDYFRRKTALERWKLGLALLAMVAAGGYAIWSGSDAAARRQASPGRLAAAHAMWDNRCEVCHQDFVPTSAGAWTENPRAADTLCRNCHAMASLADHTANQIESDVQSCAACHRDHHGASADLTAVADEACTRCHAEIDDHMNMKRPPEQPIANVKSFDTNHPDFHPAKRSSSDIKFSHARHLIPGLLPTAPVKLDDLDPADRERYRQGKSDGQQAIQLVCASCHRLDRASDMVASDSVSVRQSGDYMLPISYDHDCKACHPLSDVGRQPPPQETSYLAVKPAERVPHGLKGADLRRYVEQVLDAKFINESDRSLQSLPLADVLKQPLEKWRLPSRLPQVNRPQGTVGEYLAGELETAVKNLRIQCTECHRMKDGTDSLDIEPVTTHPVWLAHARFSHIAHRNLNLECTDCHAIAPLKDATVDLDTGDPYIPSRQVCLKCHGPLREGQNGRQTGGAPADCVLCHLYHDVDNPWHGRRNLAAADSVTIPEFIRGRPSTNNELPPQ
jgi:hypothetical protein